MSEVTNTMKKLQRSFISLTLNGEQILNALLWTSIGLYVAYCKQCEIGFDDERDLCFGCGGPSTPLDDAFWSKVSDKIGRAYKKERALISRCKAEYKSNFGPNSAIKPGFISSLPRALSWLKDVWERADRPEGRPTDIRKRYFITWWLKTLTNLGEPIPQKDGSVSLKPMSFSEAVDLLNGFYPEEGMIGKTPRGRKRTYGNLPTKELRKLHGIFVKQYQKMFNDPPHLDEREVMRIYKWVNKQREDPTSRIRGEKLRIKNS